MARIGRRRSYLPFPLAGFFIVFLGAAAFGFDTAPADLAAGFGRKAKPQFCAYVFVAPIRVMVTAVLLVVFGDDATSQRAATAAVANMTE
mgnify:CR=1 FL=1